MPIFWRMSAGTPEWVMLAGRLASDSVPPRLTASLKICSALRNLNAAAWPPTMSNENVEPAPVHCRVNRRPAGEVLVEVTKVMDLRHLGVVAQVVRHEPRVGVGFFHADAQRLERPAEHPAGMRIELGADGAAQRLDVLHHGLRAERRARDQVGMTADIFGQRVQRKVRAMLDRPLKHRPEQRVVAGDDRRVALRLADHVGDAADHRDVDQAVGGIGRGFDEDHRHPAFAHGVLRRRLTAASSMPSAKPTAPIERPASVFVSSVSVPP